MLRTMESLEGTLMPCGLSSRIIQTIEAEIASKCRSEKAVSISRESVCVESTQYERVTVRPRRPSCAAMRFDVDESLEIIDVFVDEFYILDLEADENGLRLVGETFDEDLRLLVSAIVAGRVRMKQVFQGGASKALRFDAWTPRGDIVATFGRRPIFARGTSEKISLFAGYC